MFTLQQGTQAARYARAVVDATVQHKNQPPALSEEFQEKQGAFVTLHTYPDYNLRGCIGIPTPVMPLQQALQEAARSATHDPRFPPLKESELEGIIIEVTLLTPPKMIAVKQPQEYPKHIQIGKHGLIVEQGMFKGLLLPQIPVEQAWNKEEFLSHTCMKAGLLPDAWFERNTKIYTFSGQIFTELKPYGEIKENKLDGSHN
jgi:hypothetical protein